MDVVLGLSLTPTAVRWVLVEGSTGEGAPIDRGARLVDETFDADGLLDDLLGGDADYLVHAVGVTWAREAEVAASAILAALDAKQLDSAVAISDVEAVEALAWGDRRRRRLRRRRRVRRGARCRRAGGGRRRRRDRRAHRPPR